MKLMIKYIQYVLNRICPLYAPAQAWRGRGNKTAIMAGLVAMLMLALHGSVQAQGTWENLDGRLGALSRENLEQPRDPPPFDLTGTWGIDLSTWQFPPPPGLKPEYQAMYQRAMEARDQGLVFNNDVGQCWPPGLPMMMNRVWPINMIQLPTSVVVVANFLNQVRWIFMDGREHSDPDLYVPSYNGESIGWWEGDALVIDTRNFEAKHHWVTDGIPISEEFRVIERITLSDDGNTMSIEYTMTDPNIWDGEWVSTKRYRREERVDFVETHCLPDLNDGIVTTREEYRVTE